MTFKQGLASLSLCLLASAIPAHAQDQTHHAHTAPGESDEGRPSGHSHHRADDYGPIGVMGDHLHGEGEFMLSYRYMRMHMDGNRDGTSRKRVDEIVLPGGTYRVAPTEMNMQMHMLGAMYAPRDWLTLMVMFPIVVIDMDHTTAMGQQFTTRASGLGDIKTSALLNIWGNDQHRVHANVGVSWPSGSIDRKDNTPASMGRNVQLPYPMQLGSGTVDLLPGVTYNGKTNWFSWGGQAMGTIRLGRNDENYRFGHEYMLTGWGAAAPSPWVSIGVRIRWREWFDVEGRDDRLGTPMGVPAKDFVPTADPDLRAGKQLEIGPNASLLVQKGALKGIRLSFEMLLPVHRDLDGPQLENDWTLTAGVQYAF